MDYLKIKENKTIMILKYLGLLLCTLGLFLFTYHYATTKNIEEHENLKIENFFDAEKNDKQVEILNKTNSKVKNNFIKVSYDYIAVLEIPSISLKKGLVSPDNYYNNVNYNIQIIKHSTMPDISNGNLVLAGHNGANYISFFKNLHKLNKNDKIYVYYNGYKYEYFLSKIYDTPKDGNIEVQRNQKETTITLITCKKNTNDTQTVYIGYLTDKEQY